MATATTNATSAPMWQTGAGTHLVYFSAPWCGHCKTFSNTWSQLSTTLATSHPNVKLVNVNDAETVKHTSPEVYAYPTLRVYHNGKMVAEFDSATHGDRNQLSNVTAFVQACASKGNHVNRDIAGGGRRRRRSSRRRSSSRQRTRQRGGGSGIQLFHPKGAASVPYPASSPAVGAPFDVPSNVPPAQQASSPTTAMPPPPYNAGLYTGKPFGGAWGNLPVTPTATAYTNQNLRSANPPPGATVNYPTGATHRPGNSYSAMVGVNHYAKGGTGPNTIQCTPCHTSKQTAGGKRRRRRRNASRRSKRRVSRSRRRRRTRGGLA